MSSLRITRRDITSHRMRGGGHLHLETVTTHGRSTVCESADSAILCDTGKVFDSASAAHIKLIRRLYSQRQVITRVAREIVRAVCAGNNVFWCGNGGSAADSQHLAAELVGRFRGDRAALRSIALTTDTSVLTGISNDYGFEAVFRRQVEALCLKGDIVLGLSTSGDSRNIYFALEAARAIGAFTVAFTGERGGAVSTIANETLRVPSKETPRIQEAHILCGHILCEIVEQHVLKASRP